jgi:hypothetical protein
MKVAMMRSYPPIFVTLVGALATLVGCKDDAKPTSDTPPATSAAALASAAPSASAASTGMPAPPNALPIPSASVAAAVNPNGLPAYQGPTGSVEGTISVVGPSAPDVPDVDASKCAAALDTYGKLFREGQPQAPGGGGSGGARPLADAIVVVTGYSGYYVPEKSEAVPVTIDTNCAYPTRTIAMTFGQRLEIKNRTTLMFGPTLAQVPAVALMVAPPTEDADPVKLYPPRPGYFTLVDRLQPFVKEDLYVLLHPLHAVSGMDGHYRIDGVPVGKLQVGVRLASIGEAQQPVEVLAGVVQKVDITLTYAPKDGGAATGAKGKDGGVVRRSDWFVH